MEGVDALLERGVLTDFYTFRSSGTAFDGTVCNSGDRVAGYSMIAENMDALEQKHSEAVTALKVLDENGADMMRRDLLPALYQKEN